MKKSVLMVAVAAAAVLTVSCTKQSGSSLVKSEKFEILSLDESIKGRDVIDSCDEEMTMNYHLKLVLPMADPLREGMEKTIIAKVLGNDSVSDICKAMEVDEKAWVEQWKTDITNEQKENGYCWWGGYECETEGSISRKEKGVTEYVVTNYTFLGGAHGMHFTTILHFDEATGKQLLIDDIFTGNYTGVLNSLVRDAAEKEEENGVDEPYKVEIHDNFYITRYGITMHYDAYEIGCYAAGDFDLEIYYDNFKHVVKPEWQKLWE